MDILSEIRERAAALDRHIALGDAVDPRMLAAARIAVDTRLARITLVGSEKDIRDQATKERIDLSGIAIEDASKRGNIGRLAESYHATGRSKTHDVAESEDHLRKNSLLFAARLAAEGEVDGVLAGSLSTTGDVLRAALRGIGTAEGVSVLSSFFLMVFPAIQGLRDKPRVTAFADGAVLPDPTAEQLVDVALSTAQNFERLTSISPKVAMLSFSTKGSAVTPSTEKVKQATEMIHARNGKLLVDGELQFDAAWMPEVGKRKAPLSEVAGEANIFVFPNLDAGNISYKIAERTGGAQAIGPVLQGLNRPMNDLSRGASVSDIVNMIAITALQA